MKQKEGKKVSKLGLIIARCGADESYVTTAWNNTDNVLRDSSGWISSERERLLRYHAIGVNIHAR